MKTISLLLVCLLGFYQQKTSIDNTIKIYFPGSAYNDEELPENYLSANFIGVFRGKNIYFTKPVNITATQEVDLCTEEEMNRIETMSEDTCELLIYNKKISNHKFLELPISNGGPIAPSFHKSSYYMGQTYTITATGNKKTNPKWEEGYYETTNYKLYISTVRNGKPIRQLICAVPKFNDCLPPAVRLAGDIDGDGLLDMLIDTSATYSASRYYLFLSSHAKPNEVFHSVAFAEFLSC